tara:strand:- start:765 stop:1058 length:294 start_codon:yes stop_codon:yes gene_type:complete
MGFFSWNCKGCGESIKAPCDIPKTMMWQNYCVVLLPNGSVIIGSYDGYGRVEGWEYEDGEHEMWHKQCWHSADKPSYSGPSQHASDQGFFYDDPEGN